MNYALITGASKGIGKAIAEELAKRKHPLLLVARSKDLLQTSAEYFTNKYGVETDYLAIDLTNPSAPIEILEWVERKGYKVAILVNNAGFGLGGLFEKHNAQQHSDMMQVNMQVPVALCSLFIPMLKKQPESFILNIASSAAYQSVPGLTVYAATKAFLLSFSRGLSYELRKTSISVTAVSPGGTDSDFAKTAQLAAKAVKAGEKLNMSAEAVAKIAVNALFARKTELIIGFVNKLGAAMVWLLPKKLAEITAAGLYKED